jgi:hypothetical protein
MSANHNMHQMNNMNADDFYKKFLQQWNELSEQERKELRKIPDEASRQGKIPHW